MSVDILRIRINSLLKDPIGRTELYYAVREINSLVKLKRHWLPNWRKRNLSDKERELTGCGKNVWQLSSSTNGDSFCDKKFVTCKACLKAIKKYENLRARKRNS